VGELMHFWGFKRPMGRLWTVLYLAPEPLSAAELGERLDMSAGGISMALSELERWGCVARMAQTGTRRDYFRAEPDIWKMVRRVLAERELVLVRQFGATLERAEASLHEAEDLEYKRERLRRLAELARAGDTLLSALCAGMPIDPAAIRDESHS
jgi:DNA-binding transcriptional regulator GbsR (MarR family)